MLTCKRCGWICCACESRVSRLSEPLLDPYPKFKFEVLPPAPPPLVPDPHLDSFKYIEERTNPKIRGLKLYESPGLSSARKATMYPLCTSLPSGKVIPPGFPPDGSHGHCEY